MFCINGDIINYSNARLVLCVIFGDIRSKVVSMSVEVYLKRHSKVFKHLMLSYSAQHSIQSNHYYLYFLVDKKAC